MSTPLKWGQTKLPYDNAGDTPDGPGQMLRLNQRLALISGAGPALVANAAGLTALVTNLDAFPGLIAVQADTGETWMRIGTSGTGTSWALLYAPLTVAQRVAAQTISNGSTVKVAFDTNPIPLAPLFTYSGGYFTATRSALLEIRATVEFASDNDGNRVLQINKNDVAIPGGGQSGLAAATSTIDLSMNGRVVVAVALSDTISLLAGHSAGNNLNVQAVMTLEQIG